MSRAPRPSRPSPRAPDRTLYQWAIAAGVVVTLAYLGMAAATLRDTIDGVPVSAIDAAWPFWLGTAAVGLLAGALAQIVIQLARPRHVPAPSDEQLPSIEDQRRGNLAWVLPAVTAVAAILLVRLYHTSLAATGGGVALFVATVATIITHYHLRDERPGPRTIASVGLGFVTHGSAFFLLTMIYSNKWRSMYSATVVALATALMLLQMTDGENLAWLRRLLYALVGGLLIGQMTWALNYWAATGWTGGAMLLVLFYFISGVTTHSIRGNLGRRELLEYVVVASLAFAIITVSVTAYR